MSTHIFHIHIYCGRFYSVNFSFLFFFLVGVWHATLRMHECWHKMWVCVCVCVWLSHKLGLQTCKSYWWNSTSYITSTTTNITWATHLHFNFNWHFLRFWPCNVWQSQKCKRVQTNSYRKRTKAKETQWKGPSWECLTMGIPCETSWFALQKIQHFIWWYSNFNEILKSSCIFDVQHNLVSNTLFFSHSK